MSILNFYVYIDGSEELPLRDVRSVIKNARQMQRLGSLVGEEEEIFDLDEEERCLAEVFESLKSSDMLMFPYEPSMDLAIDHGVVRETDHGSPMYRIDRQTLEIEQPHNLYLRDRCVFNLSSSPEIPYEVRLREGEFAGVGRYVRSVGDDEIVLLNMTRDQLCAFLDEGPGDGRLRGEFANSLAKIAKTTRESIPEDVTLIQMICLDWIHNVDTEDSFFEKLNELLANPEYFEEHVEDGNQWSELSDDLLKEVFENTYMDSEFTDLIRDTANTLDEEGFEIDSNSRYESLSDLIKDIVCALIFENGYWFSVLEAKMRAFQEDRDMRVREINDLGEIIRDSRNSGANVLELDMSFGGSKLNILLNPDQLLSQNRIELGDQVFYDEA